MVFLTKLIKMKFKIVLVVFPFDDLSDFKLRPALCLTDTISEHKHILLAFITSNLNNATESTDLIIDKAEAEFEMTGLKVSPVIKIHRIITTSDKIIQKVIGVLPESYHYKVYEKIKLLFNLSPQSL